MCEQKSIQIKQMLRGIDRYNPNNLQILEDYIRDQSINNLYDLEANLAVLKLYQFNPQMTEKTIVVKILLKALTSLPNTDFILCKCLIDSSLLEEEPLNVILNLHNLLETTKFEEFWKELSSKPRLLDGVNGFEDSIRRFICYVIRITYQTIEKSSLRSLLGGLADNQLSFWMNQNNWKDIENDFVFITNQEEIIKTKNITEKIDLENVAQVIAAYR